MAGLSKPGESTADNISNGSPAKSVNEGGDDSGHNNGSDESPEGVDVGPVVDLSASGGSGTTTVEFGKEPDDDGMEMELAEAVELAGEMLAQPGAYGMAEDGDVADLREQVEQQREAIADLANAVEILAQNHPKAEDRVALLQLNQEAFGEMYDTMDYDV